MSSNEDIFLIYSNRFKKQLEIQSYSNVISYFGQKSFDNPDVLLNDQLRDLMPLISERLMGRSQKLPKVKKNSNLLYVLPLFINKTSLLF